MIKIPRGLYFRTNTNGHVTYSIMFYLSTHNFSVSCDSFEGLMLLVDQFFSHLTTSTKFETLSSYNVAYQSSLEDTQEIVLDQVINDKKAA